MTTFGVPTWLLLPLGLAFAASMAHSAKCLLTWAVNRLRPRPKARLTLLGAKPGTCPECEGGRYMLDPRDGMARPCRTCGGEGRAVSR